MGVGCSRVEGDPHLHVNSQTQQFSATRMTKSILGLPVCLPSITRESRRNMREGKTKDRRCNTDQGRRTNTVTSRRHLSFKLLIQSFLLSLTFCFSLLTSSTYTRHFPLPASSQHPHHYLPHLKMHFRPALFPITLFSTPPPPAPLSLSVSSSISPVDSYSKLPT